VQVGSAPGFFPVELIQVIITCLQLVVPAGVATVGSRLMHFTGIALSVNSFCAQKTASRLRER
jgi:hypothetical protein